MEPRFGQIEADGSNSGFYPKNKVKAWFDCKMFCSILGPETVQASVLESNSVGSYRQLNSGTLHKQTGKEPLSRDMCTLVENYELVLSLQNNPKSQAHSRVSEYAGWINV